MIGTKNFILGNSVDDFAKGASFRNGKFHTKLIGELWIDYIMTNLNLAAKKGMFWSLTENLSKQGIHFIIGIILARLLSPSDFGLIGMCAVLIALGTTFVDSGFGIALIRKKDCTDMDYNTVFYYNLVVSGFFYIILFFTAPLVSRFFNQPQLIAIIRVLGLVIIIGAFSIIQRTILTKEINFKLQTKITILTMVISGAIGISCAFLGFGVWSLIIQSIASSFLGVCFLWIFNHWRPILVFSWKSFRELFAFGSNLLITDLVETLYRNVYYVVIGRFFSPASLGFFTRAETTVSLVTNNIVNTVKRVSYPILANLQDDDVKLKSMYRKLVKNTMLVCCTLIFGMAAVAEPLIVVLIGEKWLPSVSNIQLLCFAGVFLPLTIFNLNGINVKGRSKLYLKLQLTNKFLAIPVIIVGIFYGITPMLIGFIVVAVLYYMVNVHFSAKIINYPMKEQLKDIAPFFLISGIISTAVYGVNFLNMEYWIKLVFQILSGGILTILIYNLLRLPEYMNLQKQVLSIIHYRIK